MNALERKAVKAWAILAATAAGAILLHKLLTFLILFGLGPIIILVNFTPTLALYLTAALLLYFAGSRLLRRVRVPDWATAGLALLLVVGAGIAIPVQANREIERQADAILGGDTGSEPQIAPTGTIALLADQRRVDAQGQCRDDCQRLLLTGLARAVIQGPNEALQGPVRAPARLVRHSIVPVAQGCDERLLRPVRATNAEYKGPMPPPLLSERLAALRARGLCFRSDIVRDAQADIYLVDTDNRRPQDGSARSPLFDLRFVPLDPFTRREVLRREGGRLVPLMRRTSLNVRRLAVPLRLTLPFSFDTSTPGHWTYATNEERGTRPTYNSMMGHWLKNDVRITGLGSGRSEAGEQSGEQAGGRRAAPGDARN